MILTLVRIISILLGIIGTTFIIPIGFSLYYNEQQTLMSFLIPMIICIVLALMINLPLIKKKITLSIKQTYVVVALAWIMTCLLGAIPLYFSNAFMSFTDAVFESVSGFTTTGATVCTDIEALPWSINIWRCEMHWLGGMGIVTLTVAILPLLGVGGFQLIKAETTGPEKGKVTARITTTAKVLWIIYASLTALQTILLMFAGMNFTEALAHAFATLGTGGFSTRNASVGAFNSVPIEIICTIFMFLAGINFSLFFYLFIRKYTDVKNNSELKAYIVITLATIMAVTLCCTKTYGSFVQSLRYSSFQVVSILTTTGFSTADFLKWPFSAQSLLFLLYFIGGCSGSTAGGIKVVRWVVLGKQVNNETKKMLHPHGVFSIRMNNTVGSKKVVFNVACFIMLYLGVALLSTFIGCLGNLDVWTSLTGSLSMIGNIGPGFGKVGPALNYSEIPVFVKWWFSFTMLVGRLEIYTILIFFMPAYWKK
jgi:trk system potassium uptake protein